MKALGGNKVLGLAVGERGVLACELSRSGRGARVTRLAEFEFPAGTSPDSPAEPGKALGEFLRANRFSARRAVVGLPLRWAVVKPKEVPPAAPAAVAGLLLLQAEREFALEPQDLVFEYAGESDASAARTVLLLAVQRRRIEAVVAMAEAAGLDVDAVTLSSVALASETGRQLEHGGAVLHVAPGIAELAIQHGGQPRVLRHLRAPAAGAPGAANPPAGGVGVATAEMAPGEPPRLGEAAAVALTPELRQVLSLVPQNGTTAPTELVVWDGIGLGEAPRRWADALHVTVREQNLESLGVTVAEDARTDGKAQAPADAAPAGGARFAPAVALALEGLRAGAPATDLLHSRLVPKKESRVGRTTVWAAVLGVVLVAGVSFALYDLSAKRSDVDEMKKRLGAMDTQLKEAKASIERTTYAERWTGTDPKALNLLKDVTDAFPEGGRVWATSLALQPDGRVALGGRASDADAPLTLLKRMKDSKKFIDVQFGSTQPAGRGSNEVAFTVNFRYPGISN